MVQQLLNDLADKEKVFYNDFYTGMAPVKVRKTPHFLESELGSLADKKILVCSCGNGFHVVKFAYLAGEFVETFDISFQAAKVTRETAELNGVGDRVRIRVMDFHALAYPDETFDRVVGFSILHHVDVKKAGCEILRVLKKGGRALFFENSARNRILMLGRKYLIGKFGFKRFGSPDEEPLSVGDFKTLDEIFSQRMKVLYDNYSLFSLLSRHRGNSHPMLEKSTHTLDRFLYKHLPLIRAYSFSCKILLEK